MSRVAQLSARTGRNGRSDSVGRWLGFLAGALALCASPAARDAEAASAGGVARLIAERPALHFVSAERGFDGIEGLSFSVSVADYSRPVVEEALAIDAGFGDVDDIAPGRRPALWQAALRLASSAPVVWDGRSRPGALAAAVPLPPTGLGAEGPSVFGSVPIRTSSRALRRVTDRAFVADASWAGPAECRSQGRPEACSANLPPRWRGLLAETADLDRSIAVRRINAEVNARVAHRSDADLYGEREHWASAAETMARSAGDCEDFAILKMWLLARLGVPAAHMHVLVVRSDRLADQHAVLLVRLGEDTLVLDNLVREVRPAREARGYEPVFSVNTTGLWLHGFPGRREMASLERQ